MVIKPLFSESDMIEGCCKEDEKSQRHLYAHFCKKMLGVAMRYSSSKQQAEDILQDSFVKIFKNIRKFKQECPLEQWIRKIVVNTALTSNRKRNDPLDIDEFKNVLSSEEISLSDIHYQDLVSMIQQLATSYRVVFNLYAIEGYQHKEISKLLNISEGASKSLYARAKYLLQNKIKSNAKKEVVVENKNTM